MAFALAGFGCGDRSAGEAIGEVKSPIIAGTNVTTANPPTNPGTVAVYSSGTLRCSGTLIRRQWVLTAKQCVTNSQGQLLTPGLLSVVRELAPGVSEPPSASDIDLIIAHETRDLALLRVGVVQWEESPMVNPAALSDRALPTAPMVLNNMGYGCLTGGNGGGTCLNSGRLRGANLQVSSSNASAGTLNQNNASQLLTDRDWGGPAYTMFDASVRSLPGVAAVNVSRTGSTSTAVAVDSNRRWIMQSAFTTGNMRGGAIRQADIALVGGKDWTKIRSVHVDTDDSAPAFFVTAEASATGFTEFAKAPQARALSADSNGDRMADIVLLGGQGWDSTPTALSPTAGDAVTNRTNAQIASITQEIDAKVATGDFDGDGWTDVVVMRGASTRADLHMVRPDLLTGARYFPMFWDLGSSFGSNLRDGRLLTGDFNGDGLDDLAVVGNSTSNISTALSNGTFTPTFFNRLAPSPVGDWANAPNASTIVGDWDGDGRDDIAVLGGDGSNDIRVARSLANGVFDQQTFSSPDITNFTGWARSSGVKVVSGDYNGDGRDDIALVGGQGWNTVPIAFSQPLQPGSFFVTNNQTTLAAWAQEAGPIKVVSAHPGSRRAPTSMTVEPMENGNIVYMPMAPKQNGGSSKAELNLDILFQNTGTADIVADRIVLTFSGGTATPPVTLRPTTPDGTTPDPNDTTPGLTIAPGGGRYLSPAGQSILLPQPAPTSVTIQVQFRGFDGLLTMTAPLAAHLSPVAGNGWSWPGVSTDLPPGYAWSGIGGHHNPGGGQGFALDLGVLRFDSKMQPAGWTSTYPGMDGSQNDHYLVYRKPIFAMAEGTVANVVDGQQENPPGVSLWCGVNPNPGCTPSMDGNAVYINTGTEMMTYAHLEAGTIPAVVRQNATVNRGDFLGLSANSGNSWGPHLHVHTVRNTGAGQGTLRPMPFRGMYLIDQNLATPPLSSSPWGFVDRKGLPDVYSLIFPSLSRPPFLATGIVASQSTTVLGASASRAVDGNGDGIWTNNSVTHTDNQAQPWWKADLGTARFVASIDIYNRIDCCAERLSNFAVAISQNNLSWTQVATFPGQAGEMESIPINRTARYVRIRLLGTNPLSLAEVNVWVQ